MRSKRQNAYDPKTATESPQRWTIRQIADVKRFIDTLSNPADELNSPRFILTRTQLMEEWSRQMDHVIACIKTNLASKSKAFDDVRPPVAMTEIESRSRHAREVQP